MKYSDTARRTLAAESSESTPFSVGRKLNLEISLYEAGHSTVNTVPRTQPIMSNDDLELVAQLALLIRKTRAKVGRE